MVIWQTMIGIAGLGLLLSLLMKEVPMGTSVDKTYTLKKKLSKGLGRHEMIHQISPGGLTYLAQDFSLAYVSDVPLACTSAHWPEIAGKSPDAPPAELLRTSLERNTVMQTIGHGIGIPTEPNQRGCNARV
ncbi:hypothetical protein B0H14DRAFT_2607974 [Mycena olivaceomarginata]|nr:hypothetical protein B0H14DRAFT_2607974 [Mycena olivaceomarginata]